MSLTTMLDSAHKVYIRPVILACIICCGVFTSTYSLAQSEKYITFFIESGDSSSFELDKIQKHVSNVLAKNGVTALAFRQGNDGATAQRRPFAKGESARVKASISPGTIIKGSHFSSFPVTVTITVLKANQGATINPLVESARTQHTNNVKGLTDAISKALDSGLSKIGADLARLEPNTDTRNDNAGNGSNVNGRDNRDYLTSNDTSNHKGNDTKQPKNTSDDTSITLPPQSLTQCDKSINRSKLMVSPSSVISRGESLTIISCYRTEFNGDQQVRIKTTIKSKTDSRKTLLNSEDYVLASGYWKSTFNFDVPTSITPDTYTLAQAIYRQGRVEYLKLDITIK